ncbi:hypothetical protein OAX78_01765, partial [Planctomycetota bacterium]|nr:hypothetical protein [Planctomycetota bacterium]
MSDMGLGTKSRSVIGGLGVLSLAAVVGCVTLPSRTWNPNAHDTSVGTVTVSTPLFVPVNDAVQGSSRLAFGDLRDEAELARAVNRPNIGISLLHYQAVQAALQARYAGTQTGVDQTQRATQEQDPVEGLRDQRAFEREERRTFQSPETPEGDPTFLDVPAQVEAEMFKLLAPSGQNYTLPPEDVATLVAAYKTYMVNLEEYYNIEGFDFDHAVLNSGEFVPYRVHFTATANPGWYTRYHHHDAVVDLTLGSNDDVRILTVMPPETAQTIEQLTASLERVQTALDAEGALNSVAAKLALRTVSQTAERLEGMRANKTLVVGYPDSSTARIVFRPSVVPTLQQQDLQPVSRVLTALVLVRSTLLPPETPGNSEPPTAETSENSESPTTLSVPAAMAPAGLVSNRKVATAKETLATASGNLLAGLSAPQRQLIRTELMDGGAGADHYLLWSNFDDLSDEAKVECAECVLDVLAGPSVPEGVDPNKSEEVRELVTAVQLARTALRAAQHGATLCVASRSTSYSYAASFTPGLKDDTGDWNPPRDFLFFRDEPQCRLEVFNENGSGGSASIPPWLGSAERRLSITRGFGYASANFADYTLQQRTVAQLVAREQVAAAAVRAATAAVSSSTQAIRAAQVAKALAGRQLQIVSARPNPTDKDMLEAELAVTRSDMLLAQATTARDAAEARKQSRSAALAGAKQATAGARVLLARRLGNLHGRGTVAFRVEAP